MAKNSESSQSNSDAVPGSNASSGAPEMSITEQIAAELSRQILEGEVAQGDRLPSSRTLAQKFSTSINTVQAALGRLEAGGLITCQPRKRAVVGSTDSDGATITKNGLVMLIAEPGAIYQEFGRSWGAQILFAAQNTLSEKDLMVATMYIPTVKRKVPDEAMLRMEAMMKHAMGIIWLAGSQMQPLVLKAINRGTPVVSVNAPQDIIPHNLISSDNVAGGRLIGKVFARLGYEQCLLLTSGIRMRRLSPDLAQGFVYSYMSEGLPLNGINYVDVGSADERSVEEIVTKYLNENPTPQGIFAVRDHVAIGAIRALKAKGLRVPEDVGVISGVGNAECVNTDPQITAWRQPTKQIGEEAAKMLINLLGDPKQKLPPVMVPSVIDMRDTLPVISTFEDIPGIELKPNNTF